MCCLGCRGLWILSVWPPAFFSLWNFYPFLCLWNSNHFNSHSLWFPALPPAPSTRSQSPWQHHQPALLHFQPPGLGYNQFVRASSFHIPSIQGPVCLPSTTLSFKVWFLDLQHQQQLEASGPAPDPVDPNLHFHRVHRWSLCTDLRSAALSHASSMDCVLNKGIEMSPVILWEELD